MNSTTTGQAENAPRRSLNKISNNYAQAIDGRLFVDVPKAVFAAIAASALTCGGDRIDEVNQRISKEWDILHRAGIVPQAPSARARELAAIPTPQDA